MARLPGIELRPQAGAPASMASIEPTDLNLDEAARAVADIGAKMQRDDAKATRPLLDELQANVGRDFETAAQQDDGTKPGLAKRQLEMYDLQAAEVSRRGGLSRGKAEALRRGIEAQRLVWGQRAIDAEARNAGQFAAEQERSQKAARVGQGLAGYLQGKAAEDKALDDAYDGTSPTYVADKQAVHARHAAIALEAAREADRPALQLALENQRLSVLTEAQNRAGKLAELVVVRQARETRDVLANGVLSNPNQLGAALNAWEAASAELPAAVRDQALDEGRSLIATARIRGLMAEGNPALAVAELKAGKWDKLLTPEAKTALLNGGQTEAGQRARDALEAGQYSGDIPASAEADAQASGDVGLQAQLAYRRAVGFAEAGALTDGFGGGSGGFEDTAAFVIGLEGGDAYVANDNGRGPTRYGINSAANPDVDVKGLTLPGAKAIYKKRYWTASGADRLPPDLGLIQFDTAVNMGVETARGMLAASGGNPGKYLALREARYRELAKQPQHADDLKGWLGRLDKVRGEAARLTAFVNTREGVASDPMKFALKAPALRSQVPALTGEPGDAGWGVALQGRLALARQMNERYHAPLRMLTDGEAAYYRDRLAQDPTQALTIARAALAAVGPVATRSLLSEVGAQGDPSVHLHLADLYAMGSQEFAQRAERGLALKAKGTELAADDLDDLKKTMERRKGLFVGADGRRMAVFATAQAAMLADSQSGTPKDADAYVAAALGGRMASGRAFGGIGVINERAVILPSWLAADQAEEALEVMAEAWATTGRGPAYASTGKPVPASKLRDARLQLLPNGRYRILNTDGVAATTAEGRPFEFDWDNARGGLHARLGARAVLAP